MMCPRMRFVAADEQSLCAESGVDGEERAGLQDDLLTLLKVRHVLIYG